MTDHSAWTDPDVIAQCGAAAAALVAAGIVTWQAILTRRALRVAEEGRELSDKALALAGAEQERTTVMAIEAVKTRIASRAPSLELTVDSVIEPRYQPSAVPRGAPQPWPEDTIFTLDDLHQIVIVRVNATLSNTGSKTVKVRFAATQTTMNRNFFTDSLQDYLLQPSGHVTGTWDVARTVREWIDIYNSRRAGEQGAEKQLTAFYDDNFDSGALYWYNINLGGTALIPAAPGRSESWKLADATSISTNEGVAASTQPIIVKYFLSKSRNVPLPDVPSITLPDSWSATTEPTA